jgi:hypothetical protein
MKKSSQFVHHYLPSILHWQLLLAVEVFVLSESYVEVTVAETAIPGIEPTTGDVAVTPLTITEGMVVAANATVLYIPELATNLNTLQSSVKDIIEKYGIVTLMSDESHFVTSP